MRSILIAALIAGLGAMAAQPAHAVTHCGYDAFHLARLGGKWKITNLCDSFKPTGCGPAW